MLEKAKCIKAIFFDVDGTLYDHEIRDFPESTKTTLELLGQQGYQLYVATSRSEQELANVIDIIQQYPFAGIITCGGAMTRIADEIVDVRYMDDAEVEAVMAYCRTHQIDVRWQSKDNCFFDFEARKSSKEVFDYLYQMVPEVQAWKRESIINLLCYTTAEQSKELVSMLPHSSIVDYGGAIEITGKYVNKATAIARLIEKLDLTLEEVAVFGDGENDEWMLRDAGIGVAMGNGSELAKLAADFITGDIREDGLANACRLLGFVDEGAMV